MAAKLSKQTEPKRANNKPHRAGNKLYRPRKEHFCYYDRKEVMLFVIIESVITRFCLIEKVFKIRSHHILYLHYIT